MIDAIQAMQQLGVSKEIILILLIIIFIATQILSRLDYFHRYYTNKEFDKINHLLSLKEKLSDESLKVMAQEVIDEYVFRKCTNISASKKLRKLILEKNIEYDIELYHFKRASRFFQLTELGLEIKISKLDIFGKYFNYFFSVVLFLLLLFSLFIFLLSNNKTYQDYFTLLLILLVLGISSIYVLVQNFPIKSALYLKNKLGI